MTERSSSTTDSAAYDDGWITTKVGATGYRAALAARTHAFLADEPEELGGSDTGPTPYEYLLGALGSCMAITLRMYADRKGWPLESIEIRLRTARVHEPDCEKCATNDVGITTVERVVVLDGALTDEQRARLMQVAERCPVKQTLERGIRIQAAS